MLFLAPSPYSPATRVKVMIGRVDSCACHREELSLVESGSGEEAVEMHP